MAEKYSLIVWGGYNGKTVSISATTDLVTLSNHGLPTGKKLWCSGTLPPELSVITPVYVRSVSTTTYNLYQSEADALSDTNKIMFAGSGTYSNVLMKSDAIANPSTYFQFAGLYDLSRWYDSATSSYLIFDGRVSCNTQRAANTDQFTSEVIELGEDFIDWYLGSFTLSINGATVKISSKVNGFRSPAWHNGSVASGYIAACPNGGYTAFSCGFIQDLTLEGFSIWANSTNSNGTALQMSSRGGNVVTNMIIYGAGTSYGYGVNFYGAMSKFTNNLVTLLGRGVVVQQYTYGALFANNTIVKNALSGITCSSTTATFGKYYNNVVFGNTANWQTGTFTAIDSASHNVGESGDVVWNTTGGTTFTCVQTDFNNYTNGDYRPSIGSMFIDAGVSYNNLQLTDLEDNERPSYNNGGAETADLGCFEYDKGFGPHPTLTNFTFTVKDDSGASVTNFEYRIYLKDPAAGIIGTTELDGSEVYASSSRTWQHSYSTNTDVVLQIIKDGYEEALLEYTLNTTPLNSTVILKTEHNI